MQQPLDYKLDRVLSLSMVSAVRMAPCKAPWNTSTYTGSGVLASALAMDKLRCKQMWQGMGLPTRVALLTADSDWAETLLNFGGTVMVKPAVRASIGMSRAATPEQLQQAWQTRQHPR